MLEFKNVSIYRRKKKILDNFSLKIPAGSILGLVGGDQIAKSAILEAAAGCQAPHRGKIFLNEKSIYPSLNCYQEIGYQTHQTAFYEQLKVQEYYDLFLALYRVNGRYRKRRVEEVLNFLELEHYAGGFLVDIPEEVKPFLVLGRTILHEPSWILLDDPFLGLSINYRKKMLDLLSMLWEQGTSLVMNTKMFPELTSFLTDIAVVEEGQMITNGTIESVYEEALKQSPLHLRVLDGMEAALKVLRENDLVERVIVDQEDVNILFSGGDKEEAELLAALVSGGALVHSFMRDPMNVDQIMWR